MVMNRRRALLAFGTLGVAPALGASAPAVVKGPRFDHGVASGDPLQDRVILWTRISGSESGLEVVWQIAEDDSFHAPVAQGRQWCDFSRDYTVEIDAGGLKAGRPYHYRFIAGDVTSPVGLTRTLPEKTERVMLAAASCALYPGGYFNAYRAIAELREVDAVVFLGDYIYEYGAGPTDYGMGNGRVLMRIPEPMRETVSLEDYRTRHAQYKRDPDLQAAHARAAWICVFDDHEICNNPWRDGAQNHNAGEGDWSARKAAAIRAWREWMPVRDPAPGADIDDIYRSFRFGDLAELVMLETRLLARSRQLDYAQDLTYLADETPDLAAFRQRLDDPSRQVLGAAQRDWLGKTLNASVADQVRWQVFGNQVVMARVNGPDVRKLPVRVEEVAAALPDDARRKLDTFMDLFGSDDPMPFNLDAWDGYPAERERLYDLIRQAGARAIVLSGDSHTAWANALHDASGAPVAAELGVTAISSPTRWLDSWLPDLHLAQALAERNDEVLAADDAYNGFVRLTLTPDMALGEWMSVDTVVKRDFTCFSQRRFEIRADQGVAGFVA
jgi:alkaline phosphatase D